MFHRLVLLLFPPFLPPFTPDTTPARIKKKWPAVDAAGREHRVVLSREYHRVRQPFYTRAPGKQATKALPRLPTLCPRRRLLGQKDPWQVALLRPLGRPRRRPGKIPGAEGRPARRPHAAT